MLSKDQCFFSSSGLYIEFVEENNSASWWFHQLALLHFPMAPSISSGLRLPSCSLCRLFARLLLFSPFRLLFLFFALKIRRKILIARAHLAFIFFCLFLCCLFSWWLLFSLSLFDALWRLCFPRLYTRHFHAVEYCAHGENPWYICDCWALWNLIGNRIGNFLWTVCFNVAKWNS